MKNIFVICSLFQGVDGESKETSISKREPWFQQQVIIQKVKVSLGHPNLIMSIQMVIKIRGLIKVQVLVKM